MAKAQIVPSSRMKAAQAVTKAQNNSNSPQVKPLGATPGGPAKTAPHAPKQSAIAPNVSGTKTKNPGENPGGKVKLGNHY